MSKQRVKKVIGYKVTDPDWKCHGFQYKLGETYHMDGSIKCCLRGFHFCKSLANCFSYYSFNPNNKVALVEASGQIIEDGDKCCTDTIKIVKELSWQEVLDMVNTGTGNTGYGNTGNENSSNHNSGDNNAGEWNSGNRNGGCLNSGDSNTGHHNSGDENSGYQNSGDNNTGDQNSGDYNSGNWNTGDYNSGNWNTGKHNSGNDNSGDWNAGKHSSGVFNSISDPKIMMFNQPSGWTFETWRKSKAYHIMNQIPFGTTVWVSDYEMDDEEKKDHPEYKAMGGYLKEEITWFTQRQEWWDNLPERDKHTVMDLPNFDPDIFRICTGIRIQSS